MVEIGSFQENVQHLQALGCDTETGKVSGGVLVGFIQGWALQMFSHNKAHYFKTNRHGFVYTLCGCVNGAKPQHGDLLAKGSFSKCKSCERLADRLGLI